MSTKIYNGFRAKSQTIIQLHEAVQSSFKRLEKIRKNKYMIIFFGTLVNVVDFYDFLRQGDENYYDSEYPIKRGENILSFVVLHILNKQAKIRETKLRNPAYDFDFEACFIPDAKTDSVYGVAYSESRIMLNSWFRSNWIENYSFWDNSDKPEKISNKEWVKRSQIWDRILGYKLPASVGFTYALPPLNDFGIHSDIVKNFDKYKKKYIVDTETRARNIAKKILRNQYFLSKKLIKDFDDLSYIREMREFEKKFNNGEFKEADQIHIRENMPKIRELSSDMKF